jgi:hypothetical protein
VLTALHEKKTPSKKGLLSLLSHKNIAVKSLPWHSVDAWLTADPLFTITRPTLWILKDSVPAHAWLERLKQRSSFNQQPIVLLGGDFPPAQERQWKQQLHQGQVHTLVLTLELAEKWLSNPVNTSISNLFETAIWVDCLPAEKTLKALLAQETPPQLTFLNPPIAMPNATVEKPTEPEQSLPTASASGNVHRFAYEVLAEDALLRQIRIQFKEPNQATGTSPFLVICPSEQAMLQYQKLLAEKGIDPLALSLSASMPWVLFQHQLLAWVTNPQPILLLEESTLSAFFYLLPKNIPTIAPWQWVWLTIPPTETTISHICQSLPFPLQIDCHFIQAQNTAKTLPLAWQWLLLQKNKAFNPLQPLPQPKPLSQWKIWEKLNRLLYL